MRQILKRIKNYEHLGLGLIIHWGLYSQLEVGEWAEYLHKRKPADYEKLIRSFSARNFDPLDIARQAKNMGANYIVLTVKHHEGFFLYGTKGLSTFDALHSKARRDLVSEFVTACKREGLKPFFYVATYDWHSSLYKNNFKAYLDYLLKSVKVLCCNYGSLGGFWFDGDWQKKKADWKLARLYKTIRKYQPQAIIVNNTGLKNSGKISNQEIDVVTYERHTPKQINHGDKKEKYVAGEISLTMNQHWGYAKNDLDFKSPKEIIESIAHARKIGANILLNIGLTGSGKIPLMNRALMKTIGKWTKMAKPALYKTRPDPKIKSSGQKKDFVLNGVQYKYLFIHDLGIVGDKNVVLGGEGNHLRSFVGIYRQIKQIRWLDNKKTIPFRQDIVRGLLTVNAAGYTYGYDWCVRVAQIQFV